MKSLDKFNQNITCIVVNTVQKVRKSTRKKSTLLKAPKPSKDSFIDHTLAYVTTRVLT